VDRYVAARNALIEKDLIAFDGTIFQVLELPAAPPGSTSATELKRVLKNSLKEVPA
jgi:hypothetical protein